MLLKRGLSAFRSSAAPLVLVTFVLLTACSSNDDSDNAGDDAGGDTAGMESTAGTTTDGTGSTAGEQTDGGGDTAGGDTEGGTDADSVQTESVAFAATASFPSGQLVRISLADGYTVNGSYPATTSDIRAETDGETIYQLGRLDLDSLTKFDPVDTSIVGFQYSVNGDETGANPHDVVFASETKAYVLRYGSPIVWVVNPSAHNQSGFLTGLIDLSAYDPDPNDADNSPKPTSGVIVDDKLFVLMQRLSGSNGFQPIEQGYVAVIDTTSDTEIDTGKGEADNLFGIPLGSLNPTNIRYNETTEEIYLTSRGNIFVEFNMLPGDPYTGGLYAIDDATYDLSKLLDDGDEATNNGMGFIERTFVISDDKGYVSLYAAQAPTDGSSRSVLHTFNLATGELGEPVAALNGQTVTTMTMGSDGFVWVGVNNGSAPGFIRLNPEDDTAVEPFIATELPPLNVVFIDVPQDVPAE